MAEGRSTIASRKRVRAVLIATAFFMVVELAAGIMTHSLALLADAGHMLSDVASLGLALIAFRFSDRPPTMTNTYGYYRAEILAAFANGVILVGVSVYVFAEAASRFRIVPQVESLPMLAVAVTGLALNLASAALLKESKGENLNARGAYLHVLADAAGSVGAIAAAVTMLTTGWYYADPLISVFIGLLVLIGAWRLLKETVHILMEGTPRRLDLQELRSAMEHVAGVRSVRDLHVWTVTSGFELLSARIGVDPDLSLKEGEAILQETGLLLRERFGITHATLQPESTPGMSCPDCDAGQRT